MAPKVRSLQIRGYWSLFVGFVLCAFVSQRTTFSHPKPFLLWVPSSCSCLTPILKKKKKCRIHFKRFCLLLTQIDQLRNNKIVVGRFDILSSLRFYRFECFFFSLSPCISKVKHLFFSHSFSFVSIITHCSFPQFKMIFFSKKIYK